MTHVIQPLGHPCCSYAGAECFLLSSAKICFSLGSCFTISGNSFKCYKGPKFLSSNAVDKAQSFKDSVLYSSFNSNSSNIIY